jgi:hypothetical protein
MKGVRSELWYAETGELTAKHFIRNGVQARIVHAQRARKLRRRGEQVIEFGANSFTGRKQSAWFVKVPLTHPVDILKDLGVPFSPEGEANARDICDREVE